MQQLLLYLPIRDDIVEKIEEINQNKKHENA